MAKILNHILGFFVNQRTESPLSLLQQLQEAGWTSYKDGFALPKSLTHEWGFTPFDSPKVTKILDDRIVLPSYMSTLPPRNPFKRITKRWLNILVTSLIHVHHTCSSAGDVNVEICLALKSISAYHWSKKSPIFCTNTFTINTFVLSF